MSWNWSGSHRHTDNANSVLDPPGRCLLALRTLHFLRRSVSLILNPDDKAACLLLYQELEFRADLLGVS